MRSYLSTGNEVSRKSQRNVSDSRLFAEYRIDSRQNISQTGFKTIQKGHRVLMVKYIQRLPDPSPHRFVTIKYRMGLLFADELQRGPHKHYYRVDTFCRRVLLAVWI